MAFKLGTTSQLLDLLYQASQPLPTSPDSFVAYPHLLPSVTFLEILTFFLVQRSSHALSILCNPSFLLLRKLSAPSHMHFSPRLIGTSHPSEVSSSCMGWALLL